MRAGWTNPVGGFYAYGCWRVSRLTNGWEWRCALAAGLPHPHAGKRGKCGTLREAMDVVEAQERPDAAGPPTTTEGSDR